MILYSQKNCLIGDQNVGGAIDCTLGETEIIDTVFQKKSRACRWWNQPVQYKEGNGKKTAW